MTKKEESHIKYESLSSDDKEKLRRRAINKLPELLKRSELAIMTKIYLHIRKKI